MDGMHEAQKRGTGPGIVKAALVAAVIFLIVIPSMPFTPGAGLDPSWILGINMGHFDRMVFGRDIVFTYGPLGYLMMPTFPEANPWSAFAFLLGIALITGYALWRLCWRARHWTEICLYLAVFWIYSAFALDSPIERPLGAVIALTLLIASRLDEAPWFDVGLLFCLAGMMLLAKFNIGIIASLAAFYFAACLVWLDRSRLSLVLKPAAVVLSIWIATLAGLYWISDGTLGGLIAFFRGSFEIANGYSEAMGLPGPLWIAAGSVADCLALWIVVPLAAGSLRRILWGMPLLFAIGFLCFKSAMVRQDAHALPFPFEMAAVSLIVVALASTVRSRIVVAAFALGSIALGLAEHGEPPFPPARVDRLRGLEALENFKGLLHWPAIVHSTEERTRLALEVDRLQSGFSPYVEGKKVTAYPWEIAMIRANHLRWQPLPVFQAYSAYTPMLDSLNAEALKAPSAPEAVLLAWDSIDGRYPFYETPRSWLALFDWYDLKLRSHNAPESVAVLTRRSVPRFGPAQPMGRMVAHWGQTITLPLIADDEVLVMEADVSENIRGILKRELFRSPIVEVRATLRSGFIERRRLIQANLKNGVIVSDWPKSLGPLLSMFAERGAFTKDRVVSISLHTYYPAEFRPAIRIRWSRLKLRQP
jgi:hypothetical protein